MGRERSWEGIDVHNTNPDDLQEKLRKRHPPEAGDCGNVLNAATVLETLRVPPGNRLEALERNRKGQHSIRINDQWRVCFVWQDGHAFDVEIVDYH